MDYAWYCASCGGLREDRNIPERQAVQRYLDSDEYAWLTHYGLPTEDLEEIASRARSFA